MKMRILEWKVPVRKTNLVGKLIQQHLDRWRRDLAARALEVAVFHHRDTGVLRALDMIGRLQRQRESGRVRNATHCVYLRLQAHDYPPGLAAAATAAATSSCSVPLSGSGTSCPGSTAAAIARAAASSIVSLNRTAVSYTHLTLPTNRE